MYMVYLTEHGCSDSNYNARTLGSKLLKHFKRELAMGKLTEDKVMLLWCTQERWRKHREKTGFLPRRKQKIEKD